MKLDELLSRCGWTEDSITKIYHGYDHCCRCGCGGTYHERGSVGFKRALNRIKSDKFIVRPTGDIHYAPVHHENVKCEGIDKGGNYINIPEAGTNDKCYCLYNN